MKTFLEHILLTEDRVSTLKQIYHDRLTKQIEDDGNMKPEEAIPDIFQHLISIDPTPNNTYLQWLLNILLVDADHQGMANAVFSYYEDSERIREDLITFERCKQRMPLDQRDINKCKSYYDLTRWVTPFINTTSKTQEDKSYVENLYKSKQITIVYSGSEGKVEIPHTIEASKHLGRGTRWCTAAEKNNYFDHYDSKGRLYVVTHTDGKKWQFHLETLSFMNADDIQLIPYQIAQSQLVRKAALLIINKCKTESTSFAMDVLEWFPWERDNHLVDLIATHSRMAFLYARDVLKGRFKKGEEAIASGYFAGLYQSCELIFRYANEILHGRFESGEKYLLTAAKSDFYPSILDYVRTFKKSRWHELETILLRNRRPLDLGVYASIYKFKWLEAEKLCKSIGPDYYKTYEYWSKRDPFS